MAVAGRIVLSDGDVWMGRWLVCIVDDSCVNSRLFVVVCRYCVVGDV